MSTGSHPDDGEAVPPSNGLAAAILGSSEVALFENLYVAHASEARAVARAILGDADAAADAVHNGFVEMLRYVIAGRRWHDPAQARSMVLRNVRWAALNLQRVRRRLLTGATAAPDEVHEEATWARAEARAICEQIVARLSPQHQQVLSMRYVDGFSNIDIATSLQVSVGVVESRLQRALHAARRAAGDAGLVIRPAVVFGVLQDVWRRGRGAVNLRRAACRALTAVSVAACVTPAAVAVGNALATAAPVTAPSAHRASANVTPVNNEVDTSPVLDAVLMRSGDVLALVGVRGCSCHVVVRSDDAGGSWSATSAAALPTSGYARHAAACGPAAGGYCRSGAGLLLGVGNGRLLYFAASGGVLCSSDAGRTWAPRCALGTRGA